MPEEETPPGKVQGTPKKRKAWIGTAVLLMISFGFLFMGYAEAWFDLTLEERSITTSVSENSYHLTRLEIKMPGFEGPVDYDTESGSSEVGNVARITWILTLAGIIFSLIALVAVLVAGARGWRGGGAFALLVVGLILVYIAPLYFSMYFPDAIAADAGVDFPSSIAGTASGTYDGLLGATDYTFTWEPGLGWLMMIVGVVIQSIGVAVFGAQMRKRPE